MMRMITDTSLEGMRKLSVLGIGDIRQRISNAKDQEEVTRLLVETIKKANQSVNALIGPGGSFEGGGAALEAAVTRQAIVFNTLSDNLNKRVLNPMEADFANTMQTLKAEIWVPLQELFAEKVYPEILRFTGYFSKISNTIVKVISDELESSFEGTGDVLNQILIGLLDFTIGIVEGVGEIKVGAKVFADVVKNIYDWMPGTPEQYIDQIYNKRLGKYVNWNPGTGPASDTLYGDMRRIENPEWVKMFGSEDATSKNPVVKTLTDVKNELIKIGVTENKTEENTRQTADNTEPKQTMSSYLMETTNMLDTAIRGVLGVGGVNQMEKVEGLLEQLVGGQGETINMTEEIQTSTNMLNVATLNFNGGF